MTKPVLSKLRSLALNGCFAVCLSGCPANPIHGGIETGGASGDPSVLTGGSGGESGSVGADEEEDDGGVVPDGFVDCPPAVIGGNCGSNKVCPPAVNGRCQCKSRC